MFKTHQELNDMWRNPAYKEGYYARMANKAIDANPHAEYDYHPISYEDSNEWMQGWHDANVDSYTDFRRKQINTV